MPPARTGSAGNAMGMNALSSSHGSSATPYSRPARTERTHSENQERAYIAASRRSDRSLEARVESARRASEIHKQRTGRALRVTEQDVINEEMYEEEDDDLPHQYRRLTAHLHNNSGDFNRRLSSYLGSHVAIRQALQDAITSSYAQTGQQAPSYSQSQQLLHNALAASTQSQPAMQQPDHGVHSNAWAQMANSNPLQIHMPPHILARTQPQTTHQRSQSTSQHSRSSSMSAAVQSPQTSATTPKVSSPAALSAKRQSLDESRTPQDANFVASEQLQLQHRSAKAAPAVPFEQFQPNPTHDTSDYGAFSTALPAETQMFINQPVEPAASDKLQMHNSANQASMPYSSITQTLALPQLDTELKPSNMWNDGTSAAMMDSSLSASTAMFGDGMSSLWDEANNNGYVVDDDCWNAFINPSSYDESTV